MASLDELSRALVAADKAGDEAGARILAAEIQRMRSAAPEEKPAKDFGLRGEGFDKVMNYSGRDAVGGAVRGAGSIGSTILRPFESRQENEQRRRDIDAGLTTLIGSDPESMSYQTNKLLAEVGGTAGAPAAVGRVVGAIPGAASLGTAISSGGFATGGGSGFTNWLLRSLGGGVAGASAAGLVDPQQMRAGGFIGSVLPGAAALSGKAGNFLSEKIEAGAKRLMQSAIKPTIAQLKTGEAETAVKTLLERGINPNEAGVNKLRALIDDVDTKIGQEVAGSTATIDKQNVINRLAQTRTQFGNQVSPTGDLAAIQTVADDFLAHPSYPGSVLSVQNAQDLKRGTYKVLNKKYGQMGSAETEAQKALARGLKEEIANAVPAVRGLNAEESKLITTLEVAERRALMELNKNPMGLAALAQSPSSWAMFMADKSALFKSLAARMLNSSAGGAGGALTAIGNSGQNALLRNVLVRPQLASEGGQ